MKGSSTPVKFSIWHWFVGGLVASLGLSVLVVWLLDPRYLFNDDMIIASILSGDYTGIPDPKSIYGGSGVSLVLAWLSNLWSDIPWFLVLCTWCNVNLLLLVAVYLFRQARLTGSSFWVIALPLIIVQSTLAVWVLLLPSYSAAAAAAGASALIVLFIYLQSRPARHAVLFLFGSLALFAIGWGIREGGFPVVGLFIASTPAVGLVLWRLHWLRAGLLMFGWLSVIGVDRLVKKYVYADALWVDSLAVIDRLNLIWSGYVFGSVVPIGLAQGWSGAEVGLIQYLSPVPSTSFSRESLDSFIEAAQVTTVGSWAVAPPTLSLLVNTLVANKHAFLVIGFLSLALMAFLMITHEKALKVWIFLLAGITSVSVVIVFLGVIRNNTGHVSLPLSASAMTLLAMAILLLTKQKSKNRSYKTIISATVVLCLVFLFLSWNLAFGAGSSIASLQAKKESWKVQSDNFRRLDPKCLILGVNLGAENAPARDTRKLYATFPLLQLTWNSLAPHTDTRLKLLGEKSWGSLFDSDSCIYFAGGAEHAEMVADTARRQYGAKGSFEPIVLQEKPLSGFLQWRGE